MSNFLEFIKRKKVTIIVVMSVIAMLLGLFLVILKDIKVKNQEKKYDDLKANAVYTVTGISIPQNSQDLTKDTEDAPQKVEITCEQAINFAYLQEQNPDVYAWVMVPGTDVSYPVVQNQVDDYYLKRNLDGTTGYPGCVYSNAPDSKDFTGFISVLYAHNMQNGTMFGSLKNYYEEDFFIENDLIIIYTPTERLTYEIVKTRKHSDAYIYQEFLGYSEEGKKAFLDLLGLGEGNIGHVRDVNAQYSMEDQFVILSTCVKNEEDKRYLVIGKLVERAKCLPVSDTGSDSPSLQ